MVEVMFFLLAAYAVVAVLAVFTYFGVDLYNQRKIIKKIRSLPDCHRKDSICTGIYKGPED